MVSKRGSGTFINTDSLDSVVALVAAALNSDGDNLADVFEMRHLLEPPIAALAAQRASGEQVERMRQILEEQRQQIAAGETGVESDTAFHFTLASATHNSALIKVVSAVEDILHRSRDRSLQEPGRPQRSLASHHEILDMIEAGGRSWSAASDGAPPYHGRTGNPSNLGTFRSRCSGSRRSCGEFRLKRVNKGLPVARPFRAQGSPLATIVERNGFYQH